ncbi:MAG TPA: Gfo/Idh/MocA family oxidoreductase [Polyangiaceae bacterium]|nr:Gfo/Idh/MocA family oxidoreductase [Polyangiaceae bacterium]
MSVAESIIRLGIVGTGRVGESRMKAYDALPGARVVACADVNEAAARRVAEAYGVADVYANFRDLLARDDIDAVDVCLHNNFHMAVAVAALAAGKHVHCEKPMAGSYRDAVSMVAAAHRYGRRLHIQLSTMYADETLAARELIDAGELGEIYHARSSGFRRRGRPYVDGHGTAPFVQKRQSSGGALYDMGTHHIAQALHLLGNPPVERISGHIYQKMAMDERRRSAAAYDVEELGVGFVRLAGGVTLDIVEAWAAHLDRLEGSTLLGSKGGLRLQPFGFFKSYGHLDVDGTVDLERARCRFNQVRGDAGVYASSQAHWVAALQGKVELLPTAELALRTMLVTEGIYLSSELGREVTSEEVERTSISTALDP